MSVTHLLLQSILSCSPLFAHETREQLLLMTWFLRACLCFFLIGREGAGERNPPCCFLTISTWNNETCALPQAQDQPQPLSFLDFVRLRSSCANPCLLNRPHSGQEGRRMRSCSFSIQITLVWGFFLVDFFVVFGFSTLFSPV